MPREWGYGIPRACMSSYTSHSRTYAVIHTVLFENHETRFYFCGAIIATKSMTSFCSRLQNSHRTWYQRPSTASIDFPCNSANYRLQYGIHLAMNIHDVTCIRVINVHDMIILCECARYMYVHVRLGPLTCDCNAYVLSNFVSIGPYCIFRSLQHIGILRLSTLLWLPLGHLSSDERYLRAGANTAYGVGGTRGQHARN